MADDVADYLNRYEAAKLELDGLIRTQEKLAKKKVFLRKELEHLRSYLESEGVESGVISGVTPLIESTTLAQDIRTILRYRYPRALSPNVIKSELISLGRELSKYRNPQSTIQSVLKRMTETGDVVESKGAE